MIQNRVVQKYYALATLTLIGFLVLGFFTQRFLERSFMQQAEQNRPMFKPPVYLAKLLDRLNENDKLAAIHEYTEMQGDNFGPELVLYDAKGLEIFPLSKAQEPTTLDPALLNELKDTYQSTSIDLEGQMDMPPPPPPPGENWDHNNRPPPPPRMQALIVRLKGSPAYFLKILPPRPMVNRPKPNRLFPAIAFLSLFGSLILGIGVTIFIVYSAVVKHTKKADEVLAELQKGNLKARFPIEKNDEIGQAKMRFNKMADEIELLVEHLRSVESSRIQLMQELAHDLRTPIASLKNLIETLQFKDQQLSSELKKELLVLSSKEIEYFERLVEDLLLLAQVSEPKYKVGADQVNIAEILSEEIYNAELKSKSMGKKIDFISNVQSSTRPISADPHLIKRLIRNALENAISFANSKVSIRLQQSEDSLLLNITDDGSGFSPSALKQFGERRLSRKIESSMGSRVSVGLGSVIMKTIANLHRGHISANNEINSTNEIIGASVQIILR